MIQTRCWSGLNMAAAVGKVENNALGLSSKNKTKGRRRNARKFINNKKLNNGTNKETNQKCKEKSENHQLLFGVLLLYAKQWGLA